MSDIRKLLEALENNALLEADGTTFRQEELTPVIINPPSGKPGPMPPSKDGKQHDVEVINTGKPQAQKGGGDGQEKDSDDEKDSGESGKDQEGQSKKGDGNADDGDRSTDGKIEKETKKTPKTGKDGGRGKPQTIDSHEILQKSNKGEAQEIAEKILEKAEHTRKERGEESSSEAGTGAGHFMDKLRGAHKPKINWVSELRKKITEFKSQTAAAVNRYSKKQAPKYKEGEGVKKSKSYTTWLKDPKSHTPGSNILFKGPYVKAPVGEAVLIVALDTSGSIPASTVGKVFAEMDKIARSFKSGISHAGVSLEGKVYFMTWDTRVAQVEEYKPGEWKKYAKGDRSVKGGGGTDPSSIFKYMNEHFLWNEDKPSAGLLNIIKKPAENQKGLSKDDIVIPIKNAKEDPKAAIAPFVVIATDGYFYGDAMNDSVFGKLYKDNKDNILYLVIDGTTAHCNPKNIIEYESYRV